jgi:hypothetical protein
MESCFVKAPRPCGISAGGPGAVYCRWCAFGGRLSLGTTRGASAAETGCSVKEKRDQERGVFSDTDLSRMNRQLGQV